MTDRPIIFSAPMIRALLAGRKTQTRRVLNPGKCYNTNLILPDGPNKGWANQPYAPRDRLWVREAWWAEAPYDGTPPRDIEHDACNVLYEADGKWSDRDQMNRAGRLRPSIHMPRWASRLTLTVTDVRVQRLNEISEDDAEAEGARPAFSYPGWDGVSSIPHYRWGFHELWDSLHSPGAWDANPWICALTFAVRMGNIDSPTDAGLAAVSANG